MKSTVLLVCTGMGRPLGVTRRCQHRKALDFISIVGAVSTAEVILCRMIEDGGEIEKARMQSWPILRLDCSRFRLGQSFPA